MSKLEELIEKLCHNGVEKRKLWEITIWDKKFNETTKEQQESICKYKHVSAVELKSLACDIGDVKLL